MNSVSYMRRMIAPLFDYAARRAAFGSSLLQKPLHCETLADLEWTYRGNLLFVLAVGRTLQDFEQSKNQGVELRLLSSVLKLFTAKEMTRVLSEGLEGFGGLGYLEDSGIPALFRDGQVLFCISF